MLDPEINAWSRDLQHKSSDFRGRILRILNLSRDSNSLNSDTGIIKAPIKIIYIFEKCEIIINFLESGSKISAIWITEYSA